MQVFCACELPFVLSQVNFKTSSFNLPSRQITKGRKHQIEHAAQIVKESRFNKLLYVSDNLKFLKTYKAIRDL